MPPSESPRMSLRDAVRIVRDPAQFLRAVDALDVLVQHAEGTLRMLDGDGEPKSVQRLREVASVFELVCVVGFADGLDVAGIVQHIDRVHGLRTLSAIDAQSMMEERDMVQYAYGKAKEELATLRAHGGTHGE